MFVVVVAPPSPRCPCNFKGVVVVVVVGIIVLGVRFAARRRRSVLASLVFACRACACAMTFSTGARGDALEEFCPLDVVQDTSNDGRVSGKMGIGPDRVVVECLPLAALFGLRNLHLPLPVITRFFLDLILRLGSLFARGSTRIFDSKILRCTIVAIRVGRGFHSQAAVPHSRHWRRYPDIVGTISRCHGRGKPLFQPCHRVHSRRLHG
mmetsp:Transcript_9318/g.27828  ORF Transcript_9318/g.27828 Transcript_9318/m.27828 type:complete len:209 (+) Transcript_9318:1041-1667(+)